MADKDGSTHLITEINAGKELEVSWVKRGSNPKSKVFLKKSADEPQPEKTDMLKSVALAALMSSAVGVALAKSFTEDAQLDTFLAKSDADQTTELEAFAKAKGMPFGDKDGKGVKKGEESESGTGLNKEIAGDPGADAITAAVAKALESSPLVKALQETNANLTKQLGDLGGNLQVATLEKRAATEFQGLGLGIKKTVGILKALDAIDDADARADIEGVMKAHAELTGKVANTFGLEQLQKDANSATVQLQKKAEEVSTAKGISVEEAYASVCEDPANAALVAKADAEFTEAAGIGERRAA